MADRASLENGSTRNCVNSKVNLSYFHGVGKNPLVYRTVGQELSLAASEYGDREAFVFVEENRRLTYGQLLQEADQLAAGLQCLGLKIGDRVGILSENTSTWTIVTYAAARAGLISVTLNPKSLTSDIESCLRKASINVLITSENYYEIIRMFIFDLTTNPPGVIQNKELPDLTAVLIDSEKKFPGAYRLTDIRSMPTNFQVKSIEKQQLDISPDSGCNIQFTSGFTGSPKAVLLSHFSVINTGYNMGRYEVNGARFCVSVSLCYIVAFEFMIMGSLCNRGKVVIPSFMFDPEKILRAIYNEKCTFTLSLPKLYMDLVMQQKKLKLNIRNLTGAIGGSLCTPELYSQIKNELRLIKLQAAFGMIEYCGLSFGSLSYDKEKQKMETVGHVWDHLEVKVIDSEGDLVPFGTPGQLCVRGYATMIGYWGDEKKTKEVLGSDGWLKTGDYFVLEENGYGKIMGRVQELIYKGNEKIFPKEIEKILMTFPKIAEAYVVGVPDKLLGEELCAFIRPRQKSDYISSHDIYEFCKGKLSKYHIPRYIQLVEDFPKTISGKVKKLELKKNYII